MQSGSPECAASPAAGPASGAWAQLQRAAFGWQELSPQLRSSRQPGAHAQLAGGATAALPVVRRFPLPVLPRRLLTQSRRGYLPARASIAF